MTLLAWPLLTQQKPDPIRQQQTAYKPSRRLTYQATSSDKG